MPIEGVCQPEYLLIDDTLRLRRFDGEYAFALGWHQDAEMVRLVDGKAGLYDMEKLGRMYRYLDAHGELYFIEIFRDGSFVPVGPYKSYTFHIAVKSSLLSDLKYDKRSSSSNGVSWY